MLLPASWHSHRRLRCICSAPKTGNAIYEAKAQWKWPHPPIWARPMGREKQKTTKRAKNLGQATNRAPLGMIPKFIRRSDRPQAAGFHLGQSAEGAFGRLNHIGTTWNGSKCRTPVNIPIPTNGIPLVLTHSHLCRSGDGQTPLRGGRSESRMATGASPDTLSPTNIAPHRGLLQGEIDLPGTLTQNYVNVWEGIQQNMLRCMWAGFVDFLPGTYAIVFPSILAATQPEQIPNISNPWMRHVSGLSDLHGKLPECGSPEAKCKALDALPY